ncbi:MAG: hypothetical protein E7240_07780 [Lachnospiraceae bacterium]|nr:hypothetical protein [Lachnospiraceae bacterium]
MAKNKYSRDYRLIEEFNERGRVRTDYEYIGNPWHFLVDSSIVEEEKRKALRCVIFAGAAFIAALIPYSGMMHRLWIALPFAFMALPLFMTGDLVFALQQFKEPMEHRHADKMNNSYPARTLGLVYLAFIALLGETVYLILYGITVPGDAVMTFCTAVIAACGAVLFRKRKAFKAEEEKKAG